MSLSVAPLEASQHARWAELWSEYQQFYGIVIPPEVSDFTWQRLHDGRIHGLGARDDAGHLVGIVHYLFHEDTWTPVPACYLEDLYVDSSVRGSGCGRALIEAVAREAKQAGAASPYWLTHETNTTARRLYDRLARNHGFIQYAYAAS